MPRPQAFDYDVALDQAIRLFWANGFSNTSIRDLLKVMEIGESSFYNNWKSKTNLYRCCLERYLETYATPWIKGLLEAPTAHEGFELFLDAIFVTQKDPSLPKGCLMARSLSSEVMDDPALRDFINGKWNQLQGLFISVLQQGKEQGEYVESFEPSSVASLFAIYMQGILRIVQFSDDLDHLRQGSSKMLAMMGI